MAQETRDAATTVTSPEKRDVYLDIDDLRKEFGDIVAVDGVNLSFGSDELITIVGPSGCGKTTTLRCIAGLEKPTSGTITVNGKDITREAPKDRALAFVFQDTAIFPHLSVRENIRFGLDHKTDLPKDEKNHRVEEAAEMLGIGDMIDRDPTELSGGQQQRVSIGRAMVIEPSAFLLDEPFASLDANLRDRMQTEIKKLQQQLETLLIFVTHDQGEAMSLADRLVVMDSGQVQQVGKPHEIYNDPENLFVAQFIGSPPTNIFECEIVTEGERIYVTNDSFRYNYTKRLDGTSVSDGDFVSLAVRPENVTLVQDGGDIPAKVSVVEPQGEKNAVYLTIGDKEVNSTVDQERLMEPGDHVEITIDFDDTWLFDADGERLA